MDQTSEILENLERQDVYRVWKHGMPEELEGQIRVLCTEYKNGSSDGKSALRAAITRHAGWFILSFVSRMAIVTMRRKDKDALTDGIIALHLSKIAEIDFRDAYGPTARLAFGAQQLGINLAEWTTVVCPEISPVLLEFMRRPGPVNVGPDSDGNLVFKVTPEAEARRARHKEFLKALREKRPS